MPVPAIINGHLYHSPYVYTPSAAANIAFVVVFALLTIAHGALGLKYRTWLFSTLFMLGGIGETIGYIGRVGSAYDVTLNVYFIMQVTCLIISPALFSAGLYVTIGNLARIAGPKNTLLKPLWYFVIFSSFDLAALVIQAIGGSRASIAEQNGNDTTPATHIMLAGIIIQACGNIVFSTVPTLMWYRTRHNCRTNRVQTPWPKTSKFNLFVAAIIISDAAILIRSSYRIIELAQGWHGYLITTQPWFYIFDTAPMMICIAIWVIGHPGITLGRELATSKLRPKAARTESEASTVVLKSDV